MAAGNWNLMAEKGERPSPEEHKAKMEERFAEMSERLGLTADQQAIIKTQRESNMEQMKSIKQDDSLTREQKREKMQALKESGKAAMDGYLTADQQKIMQEIKAEREKMGDKKGGPKGKKYGKGRPGGDDTADSGSVTN